MPEHSPDRTRGRIGPLRWLLRALQLIPAGVVFGLQVLASLFRMPRWLSDWLADAGSALVDRPRYVVVLGGGGIPSETGLMRTYRAAQLHGAYPEAHFIVSLPTQNDPDDSSVGRMRDELAMRGVPASSIRLEYRALNTHEQAVEIAKMIEPEGLDAAVVVVTSPFHVRRALLCFRKAGFANVSGKAAVHVTAEADFGGGVAVRYGFWDALETEIHFTREIVALLYYKLRGWI